MSHRPKDPRPWKPFVRYELHALVWHDDATWTAVRSLDGPAATVADLITPPAYSTASTRVWQRTCVDVKAKMTREACPVCDNAGRLRVAGRACDSCIRKVIDAQNRFTSLQHAIEGERVLVDLGSIPYFVDGRDHGKGDLPRAMRDLISSVAIVPERGRKVSDAVPIVDPDSFRTSDRLDNHDLREVPADFAAAFVALSRELIAFGKRRHASGLDTGSNLLAGLATGETTIAKYNDLTINGKETHKCG